jgi:hypothetical protein
MSEPNIEVLLTDESEFHCFKIIFRVKPKPHTTLTEEFREPIEIYLHTTQAIDLFSKLAVQLAAYMNKASAELLEIKSRSLR